MTDYREILPSEYDQVDQLRAYCFRKTYAGDRLTDFHDWLDRGTNVGAFVNNQLSGQVLIYPLQMMVQKQLYPMGGIAFVASYPETSGKGQINQLMHLALKKMHEQGQSVSVLNPFSTSFYRKYGWEIFFSKINYELPAACFGNRTAIDGSFQRLSFTDTASFQIVSDLFDAYCSTMSGPVVRDRYWWQRLKRREGDSQFAVYSNDQGRPCGFIRYTIDGQTFVINDFIALNHQANSSLWQFVYAHGSMIERVKGSTSAHLPFNLDFRETGFTQQMVHDMMFRIVDVQAFLDNYPFRPHHQSLIVSIRDVQAAWNQHTFVIKNSGEVEKQPYSEKDNAALITDIGSFSSMMMNYQRPSVFHEYNRIIAGKETIQRWEQAIPHMPPQIYDHF